MPVKKRNEFQISDFVGIQKSKTNPQINACYECKNFDLRENLGDLISRQGYTQKYAAPASADFRSKLSAIGQSDHEFLGATNFYVPDVGGGQEVTVWITKGTLSAETSNGAYTAPDDRDIILFFTSHQFNGTSWVQKNWDGATTGKYWLNHCILTKISAIDSVDDYKIELDFADATIVANNTFYQWTAYNITQNSIAKIFETYDVGTNQVGISITNNYSNWVAGDEIILMRNYLPYNYLLAMGNLTTGVKVSDVTFHKILNDLRIGFGGYEDRIGLSIGYRNRYFNISSMAMGSLSVPEIEALAHFNNIILDVYNGLEQDCVIDLQVVSGGSLPAGTYSFKLIGYLDGYNKILLAESSIITLSANYDLIIIPKIRWGSENKRLSKVAIHYSKNEEVFFELDIYELANDTEGNNTWEIDDNGYIRALLSSGVNQYLTSDAISSTNEANNVTSWDAIGGSVIASVIAGTPPTIQNGTYCMLITQVVGGGIHIIGAHYNTAYTKGKKYLFDFYIYCNVETTITFAGVLRDNGSTPHYNIPAATWTRIQEKLRIYNYGNGTFTIYGEVNPGDYIAVDNFNIYEADAIATFTNDSLIYKVNETTDILGYIPTFNFVRSWDQAFVAQGRTYLVNPYIDQRYLNKIFFSVIVGKSFMYDVIPPDNYYEISNFDGNDLLAAEVLPNLDFAALKKGSNHYIDSNTGQMRLVEYGKGIVSRRGLVNYGRHLIYPGQDDIYLTDGFSAIQDISDGTIRETYRGWSDSEKSGIFAIREEKDNAYRLKKGGTNVIEFILTKKGWIEHQRNILAYSFILARDGNVWNAASGGYIYYPDNTNGDASAAITLSWKSIPFDISLISELKNVERFYVLSFWVMYSAKSAQTINIKIYFDGSGSALDSKVIASGGVVTRVKATKVLDVPNKSCRYFQFGIDGSDTKGQQIIIHSLGISWIPAETGIFEK